MPKTAYPIQKHLEGWIGNATLYRIDPPIEYQSLKRLIFRFKRFKKTRYVIVSTSNVPMSGWETFIFPADKHARVLDWLELPGSQRYTRSHQEVLLNAGYLIVDSPVSEQAT